jgi:glycosyltransferase involved in cell wall biosynthesis
MKIAYVYDAAYPWVKGGAEKRVYDLALRMAQRGHEVHCYSWGWWWAEEGKKDIILDGIHLHGVGEPRELYTDNHRSISEAILFAFKLTPLLWKEKFEVVDCQGFPFFSCFPAKFHSLMGKSFLIITALEVWGDYWYTYLGFMGFFGKVLEKIIYHLSDHIICISPKTEKDLKNIRRTGQSTVIPPGINFKEIEQISPKNEEWDLIFAGRLIKEKRVDLLIRSLPTVKKNNPHVKCLIIGDGPEMEKLKGLVQELDLLNNVKFMGFLENVSDLFGFMKASNVFVLPSEREGFGMVVVEANACGLPVVVVEGSMNAAADLVQEGVNGFITPPHEKDMALKINQALKERDKLKTNCIESARRYDWNEIVSHLEAYYQKSINE